MKKLLWLFVIIISFCFIGCNEIVEEKEEEPLEKLYNVASEKKFSLGYEQWIKLIEDKEIELIIYEDMIYYYINNYVELISVQELQLMTSNNIEYRYNQGVLEWKYLDDASWIYIAAFKDLATYYNVSFSDNISSQVVKEGECVKKPNNPEREGYIFNGWYLNGELYDFESKVTSDLVIESSWINILDLAPNKIEIDNPKARIILGYTIRLKANVYPLENDYEVKWSVDNEDLATIDQTGKLTALKRGTIKVTVESIYNSNIKATCTIKIYEEYQYSNPSINLGGYEIVIMNADGALADNDPFLEGYTQLDKEYKQEAWKAIEEIYNCKIVVKPYPDYAPWGAQRIRWIQDNASLNQAEADIAVISSNWIPELASSDALIDISEYYQKYGKDEMMTIEKDASTYKGGLYGVSEGTIYEEVYLNLGLYYNVAMMEKYNITDPATLFNESKWNYTEFIKWVKISQARLPNGLSVLGGHPYYYLYGLTNAAGVKLADNVTMQTNVNHQRVKDAAELISELYEAGCCDGVISWAEADGGFINGTTLMTTGIYWFVNCDGRWHREMFERYGKNYDYTSYGYVPFPYPDDLTKEDTRYGVSGSSLMVFLKGRVYPEGVNIEDIYCAINDMFLMTRSNQYVDSDFNVEEVKIERIKQSITNQPSIEAILYMDYSKAQYDPAHDMYSSTAATDLRKLAIETMYKGADYDEKYEQYGNAFVEKFNEFFVLE